VVAELLVSFSIGTLSFVSVLLYYYQIPCAVRFLSLFGKFLQMADNSQMRMDDADLRITVNNEQYHTTSARPYDTGIFHQLSASHQSRQGPSSNIQFACYDHRNKSTSSVSASDRSAPVAHFPETVRPSQYPYQAPQPVPPVKEIGHLLSQVDNWNPISLQPRRDTASASAASQFPESHPLLVNISNSKCANLDASSSVAQNLLKNINLLGKAFSGSSATYNPTNCTATISASGPSSRNTSYFAGGDKVPGSSSQVLPPPVISSIRESASSGERLSLKYCQPQPSSSAGGAQPSSTTSSSTCDPVIANVLKSIGFNFDMSKFGSTAVPKEHEQAQASSLHYKTTPPQPVPPPPPVQGYDPQQSTQNLTTPTKASTITAYDKILGGMQSFSEIDKVLQKVREDSRSKQDAPPAVKEQVQIRSRSRHRSSSVTERSPVRKTPRSATKQKKSRKEQQKDSVERTGRHSGRDELGLRASPSPQRYDTRERKPLSTQTSSLSPSSRHRRHMSPDAPRRTSVRESSENEKTKRKFSERRASPLPRGARAGESSEKKQRPMRSSSRSRLTSSSRKHHMESYSMAQQMPPSMCMIIPPPIYPSHPTSSVPAYRKEDDWEKSTEAFLRKLREPSRPFAGEPSRLSGSGPSRPFAGEPSRLSGREPSRPFAGEPSWLSGREPSRPYAGEPSRSFAGEPTRPTAASATAASVSPFYHPTDTDDLSDLSSVSSGTIDDINDAINDHDKSATSPVKPRSKDTGDKLVDAVAGLKDKTVNVKQDKSRGDRSESDDIIVIEDNEPSTSADQTASSVKAASKGKVCGLLGQVFLKF